jgi:hypothetical protein
MKRILKPAVITSALLAVLLVFLVARSRQWNLALPAGGILSLAAPKLESPEDLIYRMLDAARAGDTKTYLNSFTGPLQQQLQQAMRESGTAQFAAYLKTQSTAYESVAVSLVGQPSENDARLRVEYVYRNRNEVQNFHLRKDAGRWTVTGISSADLVKTLIPYGTAVTDD